MEFKSKTDNEIKHEVLRILKIDRENSFFLNRLNSEIPIDIERLIYILHEMKDDSTIGIKDVSTSDGEDYLIWIEPKGLGAFSKSGYLKPVEPLAPFNQFVNYGNNAQFAGRDATMGNVENKSVKVNEELPETKELTKKGFTVNKWMLIVAIITVIVTIVLWLWQK